MVKIQVRSLAKLLSKGHTRNVSLKTKKGPKTDYHEEEELDQTAAFDVSFRDVSSSLMHEDPPCDAIISNISPLTKALSTHTLYSSIKTLEDLRKFMESHVFAVLNFMWLLKALQKELTCVDEVWTPAIGVHPNITRFINEIVLDEESDTTQDGKAHASHYELYLQAMAQVGANTKPVKMLVALLQEGVDPSEALLQCQDIIPRHAFQHTQANLSLLSEPKSQERTARIASAFTFGREDAIPSMFLGILEGLRKNYSQDQTKFDGFTYYLERHIELDGDDHGPLALQMVEAVCGCHVNLWKAAEQAATEALKERLALWDGLVEDLTKQQ